MDNLTHTLFALTLARTRLGRTGHGATTALVVASNAPDIDIVAAAGGGLNYLTWHRGPTHGPIGLVGLSLLTAVIAWSVARAVRRRGAVRGRAVAPFTTLCLLALVGVAGHILMDLPTSYGTRLGSPFTWRWFAIDWMPIVDIYLLMTLAAGLVFGRMSPEARRPNVAIVLVLMALNYGVRGVAHHEALTLAPRLFGPTLPARCDPGPPLGGPIDSWPRAATAIPTGARRCLVEIAAVPTFLSPFRWRVVAHLSTAYEVQEVNLLDRRFRTAPPPSEALWRLALRWPNQWTPVVARAAMAPAGQTFLGFARFPDARTFVDPDGATTVLWTDVRFVPGPLALRQPRRALDRVSVIIRIGTDNAILQEQFGP